MEMFCEICVKGSRREPRTEESISTATLQTFILTNSIKFDIIGMRSGNPRGVKKAKGFANFM